MEQSLLSERLRQLFLERKITWQECADLANIPLETMRNLYYGKVKDPKVSTMLNLSHVLHVSVNWLMGESVASKDEDLLLQHYRMCGVHGKSILQQTAKYEALTAKDERETPGRHSIPCIVPDGLACEGMKYGTGETKEIYTTESEAFIALEVPNNNWAPRYCKYDRILLKDRFPKNGEEALFTYKNEIYFRKYIEGDREHILRCINNRHTDLIFKRMDCQSLVCIGTAIGIIRAE